MSGSRSYSLAPQYALLPGQNILSIRPRFLPSQSEPEKQLPPHGSYPGILPHLTVAPSLPIPGSAFHPSVTHQIPTPHEMPEWIAVTVKHDFLRDWINLVTLLFDFIGCGCKNTDCFLPFIHMTLKVLLPCFIACHKVFFRRSAKQRAEILPARCPPSHWFSLLYFILYLCKSVLQMDFRNIQLFYADITFSCLKP